MFNLISQNRIIFNFRSIYNYYLTHLFQGPFKWPLSISLSTGANLKIIEKRLICEVQKIEGWFDPKIFFLTFYVDKNWVFFKTEKNYETKILEFFFHFLTTNIKPTPPPAVLTIRQKIPRDLVIYHVEKFKFLDQLVVS